MPSELPQNHTDIEWQYPVQETDPYLIYGNGLTIPSICLRVLESLWKVVVIASCRSHCTEIFMAHSAAWSFPLTLESMCLRTVQEAAQTCARITNCTIKMLCTYTGLKTSKGPGFAAVPRGKCNTCHQRSGRIRLVNMSDNWSSVGIQWIGGLRGLSQPFLHQRLADVRKVHGQSLVRCGLWRATSSCSLSASKC